MPLCWLPLAGLAGGVAGVAGGFAFSLQLQQGGLAVEFLLRLFGGLASSLGLTLEFLGGFACGFGFLRGAALSLPLFAGLGDGQAFGDLGLHGGVIGPRARLELFDKGLFGFGGRVSCAFDGGLFCFRRRMAYTGDAIAIRGDKLAE